MIYRFKRSYQKTTDRFPYLLMSDLHIGAASCDKELIASELQWARDNKARVAIAGDVFDLLLPKDHKRFNPTVLDPLIRNTDSVLNATLNMGVKILKPYADLIDLIGCGNHETSITKYHATDIIALLCERLSTPKHQVQHGGYTGAWVNTYSRPSGGDGGGTGSFVIRYHHGMGGAAPVTKGLIDFARFSSWMRDADVIWFGHKHNRTLAHVRESRIPRQGDDFELRDVFHVQTSSYDTDQHPQFDSEGTYTTNWGTEKGFAPQGRGGAKLWVSIDARTARPRIEVVM